METKTRLSVNINKVATIRNARGGNNPDVEQVAADCERFGADFRIRKENTLNFGWEFFCVYIVCNERSRGRC